MKKIKLNRLAKNVIKGKEMNQIKGGGCGCACYYANNGGSSIIDNGFANYRAGVNSIHRYVIYVHELY